MGDERRDHPRRSILLVTELDVAEDDDAVGLILDISASGARLLSSAPSSVGDRVDLTLHLGLEGPRHAMSGRVVRAEQCPPGQRRLWSHEIAVRFDEELHGYDEELRRLSESALRSSTP